MKTLYKSKWILPGGKTIIENGCLLIQDDIILDVLDKTKLENLDLQDVEVIECGNSVITPGFINLHAHLQYTDIGKKSSVILNSFQDLSAFWTKNLLLLILKLKKRWILKGQNGFVSWILDLIIEYLCWSKEEKTESFKNGLNQALKSGTTTIAQLSGEEMFVELLNNSPVKSYVFFETFAGTEEMAEKSFENFVQKYEALSQKCSKNVSLGISPHSVYNVHKALWDKIADYSRKNNVLIHTHFAESKAEIEWIKTGHSEIDKLHKFVGFKEMKPFKIGLDAVSYLKELDLPWENVTLAHINQLEDEEVARISELGVSVAHCPRSNMILHGKTLDPNKALKLFTMGLGTDSLYSNYDLNILNEARFVYEKGVDLFDVLDMLTINAAKSLKLEHITGSLEQNKAADFLVFKLDEDEDYRDFIKKDCPNRVYISGNVVVEEKS